jgi:ABC-type antimicrobial peptide transport system ATPase subunit
LFELLTGEDALPYIDASVAQQLLVLDKKFNHVGSTPDEYTSLQMRCIASIADDFHTFQRGFQSEDAAVDSLKEWPSHVLADILVKTMKKK